MIRLAKLSIVIFGVLIATPGLADGNAENGRIVFRENCSPCHFKLKAKGNLVGPNLSSVIGRKAGSFPGYKYSPAMKAASHVWTEATLLRYLAGPRKMIPGVKMAFDGFKNETKIRDLVAYLKQQQGK